VTRLREVMLEELQRRNLSEATIRAYIGTVERFSRFYSKPPDRLGPDHIRLNQGHLLHDPKLKAETVVGQVAALRFFSVRALKLRFPPDSIPYPKYTSHRIPKVISPEEVAQLIDAAAISRRALSSCCSTRRAFDEVNWCGYASRT
jgi:integrase/recombinase XerD